MNKILLQIVLFLGLILSQTIAKSQELTRIAFGSCDMQSKKQKVWPVISANNPQLWIWLGDNIYGEMLGTAKSLKGFQEKYDKLKNDKYYSAFRDSVPIIGTWDDHEFGGNDIGGSFAFKKESQQMLLDFLDEPKDSKRRTQEGVYTSYEYGEDDKKVKVILLDLRYFRDEPCDTGNILGEVQWQWLEQELSTSTASLNIIGSSIQFVSREHPFESWAKFPASKKRMLELINKTRARGVIFISGDRHFTEISAHDGNEVGYPIYDYTSSGLTHGRAIWPFERNTQRLGKAYLRKNFGLLLIDWEKRTLTLQSRNIRNKVVLEYTIPLANLLPKT